METIGISCSCSNTEAFKLSNTAAECTSCSTIHTITDEPTFITRSITPLYVIEQRAKEQAVIIDMWLNDMPYIDWSTCFDVDNITNNNICDCTAPQVDEDKMCICGLPITIEADWTNDSGYSDVFH